MLQDLVSMSDPLYVFWHDASISTWHKKTSWCCRISSRYLMPVSAPAACTRAVKPPWWFLVHTTIVSPPHRLTCDRRKQVTGENKTDLRRKHILTLCRYHSRRSAKWRVVKTLLRTGRLRNVWPAILRSRGICVAVVVAVVVRFRRRGALMYRLERRWLLFYVFCFLSFVWCIFFLWGLLGLKKEEKYVVNFILVLFDFVL